MSKKKSTLNPLKLLTDQPIHENQDGRGDGLGFTKYAETLAGAALGTEGPFTIGIFGDWGTGKTSLMRMIEKRLMPEEDVLTVWFDAWRYGREKHPIIPLVSTIIREIERQTDVKKNTKKEIFRKLIAPLRSFVYGMSLKFKLGIAEASFSGKDIVDRAEQLQDEQQSEESLKSLFIRDSLYYEAYDALSQLSLGGENGKIILFIDDMDRCLPDIAVELLESIKLILNQTGFVFVLGMSRPVIDGYLNNRYQKEFGITEFIGREYLDKIVQLSFPIPPHRERMETLARTILTTLDKEDREALEDIIPLVKAACKDNPRVTVRFFNNLLIDKRIDSDILIGYFAITRSLQQHWFHVFLLFTNYRSDEICETVGTWIKSTVQNSDEFLLDNEENSIEAQLVRIVSDDNELRSLLKTKQGLDWLDNHKDRKAAIQFLETQRQDSSASVREALMDSYSITKVLEISEFDHLSLIIDFIAAYRPKVANVFRNRLHSLSEKPQPRIEFDLLVKDIMDVRNQIVH